jgi:hypothetical protein
VNLKKQTLRGPLRSSSGSAEANDAERLQGEKATSRAIFQWKDIMSVNNHGWRETTSSFEWQVEVLNSAE